MSIHLASPTPISASDYINHNKEITPYKFKTYKDLLDYQIPPSNRHCLPRSEGQSELIYYFSTPQSNSYPITVLLEGSSSKSNLYSVIHFHRYFLKELLELNSAVLTIEKWGIDGNHIDEQEFWNHYTCSQRFTDHLKVIDYLQQHPPEGWNGQIVFIGVSEGGPLATKLSITYPNTIATINWSGAGDWNWVDELWEFIEDLKQKSLLYYLYSWIPRWIPYSSDIPATKQEFIKLAQDIIKNPTSAKTMGGMTYLYHADRLLEAPINYYQITKPLLVVAGTLDSTIISCDQFVQKALKANATLTYFRVEGMDHYVRKRPDILEKSFEWLKEQLDMSIKKIAI